MFSKELIKTTKFRSIYVLWFTLQNPGNWKHAKSLDAHHNLKQITPRGGITYLYEFEEAIYSLSKFRNDIEKSINEQGCPTTNNILISFDTGEFEKLH